MKIRHNASDPFLDGERGKEKKISEPRQFCERCSALLAGRELGDGEPSPPLDEELCQKCGRNNPVWFAPNPVWNAVVTEISGILCPICFIERADRQGFKCTGWELIPENSQIEPVDTRELKAALRDLVEAVQFNWQCTPAQNCAECELVQPIIVRAERLLKEAK